jgi:methionyl-tRNA formyltransferase
MNVSGKLRLFLVGHDNAGSRLMFERITKAFPDATFELAITTGLYYRKGVARSILKMLLEASWIFCASRAVELVRHRLSRNTLAAAAAKIGAKHFFTDDINGRQAIGRLRTFGPDFIVSLWTMHIYGAEVLSLPRLAVIGSHPGLPKYRGLETFFWAMAAGERELDVAAYRMARRIDAGPILEHKAIPILAADSMSRVYRELTECASDLLIAAIRRIATDGPTTASVAPQEGGYYPMPTRDALWRFWRNGHSLS